MGEEEGSLFAQLIMAPLPGTTHTLLRPALIMATVVWPPLCKWINKVSTPHFPAWNFPISCLYFYNVECRIYIFVKATKLLPRLWATAGVRTIFSSESTRRSGKATTSWEMQSVPCNSSFRLEIVQGMWGSLFKLGEKPVARTQILIQALHAAHLL